MQSTVEVIGDNKVRVNVVLDDNELERELDEAFKRISSEARIPGFRPGKAPRKVLEKHIGPDIARKEALRTAMPEFYAEAVREHDVDVIAYPEFEVTDDGSAGPVKFEAIVEIRPVLPTPNYKDLKVTVPSPDATEDDLTSQLDRMRSAFAELKTVERAAKTNDNVLIDLHTKRANEDVEGMSSDDFMYEVGSEGVVPELDAKLEGAKAGDIVEFAAVVPGLSADDKDELQFRVLVKEVKEKILPALTDEWASDASEFETLDELQADIKKRVGEVKRMQAQYSFRENVLAALTDQVTTEIPEALLDMDMRRYLNELMYRLQAQGATLAQYMEMTGRDEPTLTAELRMQALESVKADLVLRALATDLGVVATESDLDEEIVKIADQVQQKPEQVRHQLEHADELSGLRSDIAKTKALEWLLENVEVVDETGKAVDRSVLTAPAVETSEAADVEADAADTTEEGSE